MQTANNIFLDDPRAYWDTNSIAPDFLYNRMKQLEPTMALLEKFMGSSAISTTNIVPGTSLIGSNGQRITLTSATPHKKGNAFLPSSQGSLIFEIGDMNIPDFEEFTTTPGITLTREDYPTKPITTEFVMNSGSSQGLFAGINLAQVGELSAGLNDMLANDKLWYFKLSEKALKLAKIKIIESIYNKVYVTPNNASTLGVVKDYLDFSIYADVPNGSGDYERIVDKKKDLTAAFPKIEDFQEIKQDFCRQDVQFSPDTPMLVLLPDPFFAKFKASETARNNSVFDIHVQSQRDKFYPTSEMWYADYETIFISMPKELFQKSAGNWICPIISKNYYDLMMLPRVVNIPEMSYSALSMNTGNSEASYGMAELANGKIYVARETRYEKSGTREPAMYSNFFLNTLPIKSSPKGFAFATIKPTYA